MMVFFLMLRLLFQFFPEDCYCREQQERVDTSVVTIECVPVLFLVKIGLRCRLVSDVAIINVLFQLEFFAMG